ncbi:TBC1 domain family member 22B [Amphibalanus amphitrite]|uniref:TBC1 domain family member 22B n=1 Tax=Amphibalanus amphitrite TaxID=1232801 RepID=A0A6A4WCS0_AMPAM|nr:TBC1 domain family member 22B-like isoform X1 [Amphibalanus amphitrite]KAF0305156.1 TBC1 domain family member 22B [Amphibalanus amphitrite]
MQATGETSARDSRSAFWKKNTKTVPGRPSPRHAPAEASGGANFHEFQQSVEDAWDDGDDEFCIISGKIQKDVRISENLAHSTALNVIQSHRSAGGGRPRSEQRPSGSGSGTQEHSDEREKTTDRPESNSESSAPAPVVSRPCKTEVSQAGKAEAMIRLAAQRPQAAAASGSPPTGGLMNPTSCPRMPGHPQPLRPGSVLRHPPVRYLQDKANAGLDREAARLAKVQAAIDGGATTLDELRALCWGGVPSPVRAVAWRLLSGYLPLPRERREPTLCRKRDEYWSFVQQYYDTRHDDIHQDTYRQIHIDIPRMSPLIPLFQQHCVQEMFERVLYIWAIRHPASGYVQGVNDLVTPYFIVFLQEVLPPGTDIDSYDVASLAEPERRVIEADSFWSMSLLLDGIQDNYTFAQPGIQTKVTQLKELVQRIDAPLDAHIARHGIDYLQFAFRWMNNLLMRELPLHCTIRLWDTYLSEVDGFASFHLYVCAAFLTYWSRILMQEKDFQGLMLTLQNLPTHNWTNSEISLLVAEAFKLKYTFADAPNHLASRAK